MSSTDQQVNDDYFYYTCAYIINNNAADESIITYTDLFSLSNIGQGIQISKWNVPNLQQPTIDNLKAILPSRITQLKRFSNAYYLSKENARLLTIFRDIYNRINALPNLGTFQNNAQLI